METGRPSTALELKDVTVGSRIVVYSPRGDEREEIEIISFEDIVDHGENASLIHYTIIGGPSGSVRINEPSSLGLAQSHDGTWYRYAIPFDE